MADRPFRRHFGVDLAGAATVADPDGVGRRVARVGRSAVADDRTAVGVVAVLVLFSVTVAVLAVGLVLELSATYVYELTGSATPPFRRRGTRRPVRTRTRPS